MQTLEVLRTLEWLKTTGEAFFDLLQEAMHSQPEIPLEMRLQIVYRHAQLREALVQNARAVQVLTSFGLKEAMLEAKVILALSGDKDRDRPDTFRRLYGGFVTPWHQMLNCVKPLKELTIPLELAAESAPDDIITVNLSERESLDAATLVKTLNHIEALYDTVNRVHGTTEWMPLRIIKIESGTNVRIDLKGLGEPTLVSGKVLFRSQ